MRGAQKYLKLVGATIVERKQNSLIVAVVLTSDHQTSRRIMFPLAHFEEHADGDLFVPEWIVVSRNRDLKKDGIREGILITDGGYR